MIYSVGFQSRFQTAGTLIFKPPEQSSLKVTGKHLFTQINRDSIKILKKIKKLKDKTISKSNKIFIMLGFRKECRDSNKNGKMKSRSPTNNNKNDCIIKKLFLKTREILTGMNHFIQTWI